MRQYEAVVIFAPDLEESVVDALIERLLDTLRSAGSAPGPVNRWGKRTLAYEVNHHREGYYVLFEFSAEPQTIADLDRFLLLLDEVIRHKIVRQPEKAPRRSSAPSQSRTAPAVAG
jgi:small subunit ribosomal protein S6